jgi:hypothetical protein
MDSASFANQNSDSYNMASDLRIAFARHYPVRIPIRHGPAIPFSFLKPVTPGSRIRKSPKVRIGRDGRELLKFMGFPDA